jgi:hypothetical protein
MRGYSGASYAPCLAPVTIRHTGARVYAPAACWWYSVPMEHEHFFMCPYCGEQISMLLDLSIPVQVYIEDCEVCCQPIQISFSVEEDSLFGFAATRLE